MILKKCTLLLFCLIFLSQVFAQHYVYDSKISPEKLKTDFSILVSSLRENHPALYDFTSKSNFDSLANACLVSLTDPLTEGEFHVLVRKFTRVIGCGHTESRPSQDWYKSVKARKNLIPIHVYLQSGKLYVRNVFDENGDSLIGARIISIDGVSVYEILLEMKSIIGRDGVGWSMENRNVERMFQTYYTFLYGMKDVYTIEAELASGDLIRASLNGKVAEKYPAQKPIELTDVLEIQGAKFGMLSESKKIAVLDLNSFPSKGYKKFYRKVFKRLSEMDSINLILDVRGNGGGYFPNGNQLLRYLLNERFTMDFHKPQGQSKKNKHLKLNFLSKMTRFIFSTILDRNKVDPARNYQIRYRPVKRNHFEGEIYLLTDGLTFSAGSFVASKLENATSILSLGDETGGGEVGFNAVLSWRLDLPNSGVVVMIPIYHVDVQPGMVDVGRGVIPNLPIHYRLEQKMSQFDLEIARVLKLIEVK